MEATMGITLVRAAAGARARVGAMGVIVEGHMAAAGLVVTGAPMAAGKEAMAVVALTEAALA